VRYAITGKPLGVTREVAECEAAHKLGLRLAAARTAFYDAYRETESGRETFQIKGRAVPAATLSASHPNQRLHVQLNLGGPEGLRAIAYIALTFFAHHFRDHARDRGLDAFKAFLFGNGENNFVWWEAPPPAGLLPPNPFPFGHIVALITCTESHEATAFVSLFQSLHFGVHLGNVNGLTDKSVIVFIDHRPIRRRTTSRSTSSIPLSFRWSVQSPCRRILKETYTSGWRSVRFRSC
jgi:hypothetical protein